MSRKDWENGNLRRSWSNAYINGIISIVHSWISNDCRETIPEITAIIMDGIRC